MKVLTLNLRNFTDDHWKERLPLICQEIIRLKPEIMAFQEVRGYVDESMGKDMATQVQLYLAAQGYDCPYLITEKAMTYEDQGVWEGLSILSTVKYSQWGYKHLDLGQGSDDNKRIMLWAVFDLGTGPFFISNNHFSYDAVQAAGNAEQVALYLSETLQIPGLLMGDLNVTPDSQAVSVLRDYQWTDIWTQFYYDGEGPTYHSGDATKRIDYQWKNKFFTQKITRIERAFLDKDTETGEYPSDHYGVMVTC